jgi:hypothetical protein
MHIVGQILPLLVFAAICTIIVSSLLRKRLPRITRPAPRQRPKRATPLRMVKSDAMDRELANFLRNEEKRRD